MLTEQTELFRFFGRSCHQDLVVLGNEEQGLPRATLKACATVVSLPGSGRVQSLNVSVTAGILIHALLRGAPIEPRPAPARGRR